MNAPQVIFFVNLGLFVNICDGKVDRKTNVDQTICNKFPQKIKCKGGSTTAMLNHLKIHNVELTTVVNEQENEASTTKLSNPT